ncbi:hypothetical protein KY360_05425 [Candidatus Woesearchaeota archaeon]|nr:hypothetical protein [Candidatus Woesearchaeota archaeon]
MDKARLLKIGILFVIILVICSGIVYAADSTTKKVTIKGVDYYYSEEDRAANKGTKSTSVYLDPKLENKAKSWIKTDGSFERQPETPEESAEWAQGQYYVNQFGKAAESFDPTKAETVVTAAPAAPAAAEPAAAEPAEEGFKREGQVGTGKPSGTGATPSGKKYYFDTSGDGSAFYLSKEADQNKADGLDHLESVTKEQYDAIRGAPKGSTFTYDDSKPDDKIVSITHESKGTTTTTRVSGSGSKTKETKITREGKSFTTTTDVKGKTVAVKYEGMELSPSTEWKVNKDGQLTYDGQVAESKGGTLGETFVLKDGRMIIAYSADPGKDEPGATVEISADKSSINVAVPGRKDQPITTADCKRVLGFSMETILKMADAELIADELHRAGILTNIGSVFEILENEGIGLSDIISGNVKDGVYTSGNVKIEFKPDGTVEIQRVTSPGARFDEKGKLPEGTEYERVIKNDDKRVTEIVTVTAGKEGATEEDEETRAKWNYVEGKTTGTATIPGVGEDVEFEYNENTGNIIWYKVDDKYYRVEDGRWFEDDKFTKPCTEGCPSAEATGALRTTDDKKASAENRITSTGRYIQRFWGALETAARGGIGRFLSLFMDDEDLREWREGVDDFLCSTVIAGGTECWTSGICGKWIDDRFGGGIAYVEIPGGMLNIAAHIEGERTVVESPEKTQYLYKFTYVINNPLKEGLGFNVYFYGDRTTSLYSEDMKLEKGASTSRIGNSAVVQYSDYYYTRACIVFNRPIKVAGDTITQLCNKITEYHGPALSIKSIGERQDKLEEEGIVENQI